MIENDDGGPFLYWNQVSRSALLFSSLKIATRAEVSKNPATKEADVYSTMLEAHAGWWLGGSIKRMSCLRRRQVGRRDSGVGNGAR
jgi:hypothetical protein